MVIQSLAAACLLCLVIANSARAESGIASVYGHGDGKTASDERADPSAMTAAHRTLPFGTRVTVTHAHNGLSVSVRISDRGPFLAHRNFQNRKKISRDGLK